VAVRLLLLAAAGGYGGGAAARPPEMQPNAREACRQEVAGAYIKVYDDREKNRTLIVHLRGNMKDQDASLKTAKAELATARAAAAGSEYSVEKAERNEQAEAMVKTLEAQRREFATMLAEAEKAQPRYVAREAALKSAVAKVFTFERLEDKPDGGYPIHLNYKTACSKYRYLCPLPAAQRRDLLAIAAVAENGDGGPPAFESCRRYASIKGANE
jgi:hypothetical protein